MTFSVRPFIACFAINESGLPRGEVALFMGARAVG